MLRRMTGTVTLEELDATAVQLQASPRLDDVKYIIHDFSAADAVLIDQDDIDFMAVRASVALSRNADVKIAFVGDHPVAHALIAAFNTLGATPLRCHHFNTLAEARQFTGYAVD